MSRTAILLLTLTVAGASLTGCANTSPESSTPDAGSFDLEAMRTMVEARNKVFTEAHVVIDSAAMVNIFTSDARVLPPNADPVIGRPAIETMTAQYMAFGITEFTEQTTAFYGNAEMLVDEGTYVMAWDKGKSRESGKYVNIWRREGGEWKIHSNMWNTNAPSSGAK